MKFIPNTDAADITSVIGGTNCTVSGGSSGDATVNVDDAFLVNNGSDTTTGTITAGGFTTAGTLTVDSVGLSTVQTSAESFVDNDTSVMTSAAIQDKILAYGYSTTTGDITGVTFTCDDESTASDTAGSADFVLEGGPGINTAGSGNTITLESELSSTGAAGIVELATTAETTTGTDTSRAVTPDGLKDGYQGSTNVVTVGTIGTGTWNATAIASAKMATASASAQGAVELATPAECITGTDTTRAVTPEGLADAKVIGQIAILRAIQFYVNDAPMVQNSLYFGNALGHQSNNWGDPAAVGGVIGDTSSFTIDGDDENWGMVLPFNVSKVEVQCSLRPQLGTGDDLTVAIYTGVRSTDSSADLTLTKIAHNSVNISGTVNRYTQNDVSATADIAKGAMLYVGIGTEDNTDMKNGRGYMTVTITRR